MVRTSTRPRRTSAYHLTGAFDLLPKSYRLITKNLGIFALLWLFPLIAGLSNGVWTLGEERRLGADSLVAANATGNSLPPVYVWGGFGLMFLLALAIGVIIQIMTHQAELEAAQHKKPKLSRLWSVVKDKGWQMFGLYLLVGLITLAGFILLIVPGIIMLRRYFLAPYVMLDGGNMGIREAMEKSAAMTTGYSGSIYRIVGLMLLFAMFGIIPLLGWIAAFFLQFFYSAAPAIRYQELKNIKQSR